MYLKLSKAYQKIFYVCAKSEHWVREKIDMCKKGKKKEK